MKKHFKELFAVAAVLTVTSVVAVAQNSSNNVAPSIRQTAAPSASPTATATGGQDIIAVQTASGQFTRLLQAVQAAGLTQTLQGPGPFTVFAPTDAAFAKIPPAQQNLVLSDPNLLKQIILYHVVPGNIPSTQLLSMGTVKTQEGENVDVSGSPGALMINNANVVQPDIQASNGVIQAIDNVLIPPSLVPTLLQASASPTPTGSAAAAPSP